MTIEFDVERHGAIDSTNAHILRRAAAGARSGLVVVAESQNAGRGRLGRQWSSPPGNLYLSLLWRPTRSSHEWPQISLVVGLSLAQAIGDRAHLKWPNDVLIDGMKTAGILIEAEGDSVAIGIGVNISSHPDSTPYPVTSLDACGILLREDKLLHDLLIRLAHNIERWEQSGFAALRSEWLSRGPKADETVRMRSGDELKHGTFVDVDEDGPLWVACGSERVQVRSADILAA